MISVLFRGGIDVGRSTIQAANRFYIRASDDCKSKTSRTASDIKNVLTISRPGKVKERLGETATPASHLEFVGVTI